jgi:hypothetical protein
MGIFQITVAQGNTSEGIPISTCIISNQTEEGECLQKENTNAEPKFDNHTTT